MAQTPDEVAEFIARQLWRYIEAVHGGDIDLFASAVGQAPETIYGYTGKKRKPGWEVLRKWFDAGMSPLWLFLDYGPMQWKAGDVDISAALISRLQGAQEALRREADRRRCPGEDAARLATDGGVEGMTFDVPYMA